MEIFIKFQIQIATVVFLISNIYRIVSYDSEMEECISRINELMPSFDVNIESGKIAYSKLCESSHDNYDKQFPDMNTAELNDASEKLLEYMKSIFGK